MSLRHRIVAALMAAVVLWGTGARAAENLDPKRTWLFAVGICHWKHKKEFDAFDAKVRLEPQLIEAVKAWGVPGSQVVYLQDEQATEAAIEKAFAGMLRRTQGEDTLIVYFQGHGYWDAKTGKHFLACYDCDDHHTWAVDAIYDEIERDFHGKRAMLMGDCCGSGGLCSAAMKRHGSVAYAAIGSSFRNNGSTGAWTFTACLLAAMRGDARIDLNGDGTIELDEIVKFTELEMAFIEEQKSVAFVSPRFGEHVGLAHAHGAHDPEIGRHVEAKWDDGKMWKAEVIEKKGDKVKVRFVDDQSTRWDPAAEVRAWKPKAHFEIGAKVLARAEESEDDDKHPKWHPATVIHTFHGLFEVRFDQGEKFADQWESGERIKAR